MLLDWLQENKINKAEKEKEDKADDDYFNNKKKFHCLISAYAGVQAVNKQIKSDPMFTEYADIRNASEKKINTMYFGINLTIEKRNLCNRILFSSGSKRESKN